MTTDMQTTERADVPMTAMEVLGQVKSIQDIMKAAMREDEHYGVIPGTGKKPSLLKPGAEKLLLTFRMDAQPEVETIELPNGHREYRVKTTLYSIRSGVRLGSGFGSASTMETKWRYRTGPVEFTDKPVPTAYWNMRKTDPGKARELLGGPGFAAKKNDEGAWVIAIQGDKVEHDNPADYYNTCLKMGCKRSLVDVVLKVTAASDIFTQDVEEMQENGVTQGEQKKTDAATQTAKPQPEGDGKPRRKSDTTKAAEPDDQQLDLKGKISKALAKVSQLSGRDVASILKEFSQRTIGVIDVKTGEVVDTDQAATKIDDVIKDPDWAKYTLDRLEEGIANLQPKG